jgi:hypothetical protein
MDSKRELNFIQFKKPYTYYGEFTEIRNTLNKIEVLTGLNIGIVNIRNVYYWLKVLKKVEKKVFTTKIFDNDIYVFRIK